MHTKNSYSIRGQLWLSGVLWIGFFALVLFGWCALYANSPAFNGAATFGSLDTTFAWAAHTPPPWRGVFFMWSIMVIAMMLPTVVPMILTLYGLTQGREGQALAVPMFIAGYIVVWLTFALIASIAQVALYHAGAVDALGVAMTPALTLALLIAAGLYQFSTWKQACVRSCQTPMMFFMSTWRDGATGALSMGVTHGLICVGCCWALMALGFVGGIMNLIWMGIATLLMTLEKLPSIGKYFSPLIGCVLLALALAYGLHIFIFNT